jgi:DNA invertase Pin-like site-specific DNA recombinase
LSFAQFEREVTSERIRDKIGASKRKGLWVGGMAPLGYETKARKISVVEEEAERVRTIFRSYLELGSLHRLMADLRERGIVTKVRSLKTRRTIGGYPVHPRSPRPPAPQPVLHRRGHVQGRGLPRRAARHPRP